MSTWIKQGVYGPLEIEAAEALRLTEIQADHGGEALYITSMRDGTHGVGTLHHAGMAYDMRPLRKSTIEELRQRLGEDYDVVDEGNHWHIEYDPD